MTLLKNKQKLQEASELARVAAAEQERNSARIAQEIYRKNVELAHTNQTLSLLRAIDTLVLESREGIDELSSEIAKAIIDSGDDALCALFVRDEGDADPIKLRGYALANPLSVSAEQVRELKNLTISTTQPWFGNHLKTESLEVTSTEGAGLEAVFGRHAHFIRMLSKKTEFNSISLVKLLARQKLVGVLVTASRDRLEDRTESDKEFLERLSEAIGVAVDNKLLFEENQQVLRKLELSNKKLKELDAAKDEFISMASHQLRTPLTSIKGYLSLVLEGDAGNVSTQQREMLDQAFTSSQCMVYLIADLLNVSRLRTGKFIIEPKPTYLPDVISEELNQVIETAKARKVALNYEKPKEFPTLNLDDTKIRQVIMNFMDNAIYYTPAGGTVDLKLIQKPRSIEFLVIDNGIGVPKSEQHKLFTKFYRAGNAREARPDGTGLGLYMAKKVIVASGGALIFKTQEGKGSTFGFMFPLDRTTTS